MEGNVFSLDRSSHCCQQAECLKSPEKHTLRKHPVLKPRLACLGKFYEARGSGHKTRVAGSFLGRVFRSRFANDHLRFVMNPGLKRDIGTDRSLRSTRIGSGASPIPIFARESYTLREASVPRSEAKSRAFGCLPFEIWLTSPRTPVSPGLTK